jgi:MerR family transcriptional regulator, heat shock protein HspR
MQAEDYAEPVMSIGTLAEKVGLSESAVRKYENECLIIAHRTPSGHRRFSWEDVDRIRNIHRMVQVLGVSLDGIRRLQSLLPCWDLLPCSTEKREACPAFRETTRPCWMLNGLDCTPSHGNACRECVVYRFGSLCTEQIKTLLYDQAGSPQNSVAIRELVDRKRQRQKDSSVERKAE